MRLPESIAGGRYRVVRMLGEGGSKLVYLAHDVSLDRDVAIALIRTEGLDQAGRARLEREVRAMAKLGAHPHVVTVYDAGEENGRPFVVSEYVGGGTVEELIGKSPSRRIPLEEVLRIGREIAEALEHVHASGIVHRDLKPANVFLTQSGASKLGDFGLAIAPGQARLTVDGMVVGTVAYMAPEQMLGESIDARADLYAMGATLYEMVTGRPPFAADDLRALVAMIANVRPAAPSTIAGGVPRAIDDLILKLLEKNPGDRPAGASVVAAAIRAIAEAPTSAMEVPASTVMIERPNLRAHAAPDGTLSILFSDIENSTGMFERLGDLKAQELLRAHNAIIRKQVGAHHGFEVKSMGDGFMIAFPSAREALLCAIAIQRDFAAYSGEHREMPIRVRIGLHVGEAIKEGGDLFGTNVIVASRIGAIAEAGSVLVSSTFKEVAGWSGDVRFDEGREVRLKGLSGTYRVYRVAGIDADTGAVTDTIAKAAATRGAQRSTAGVTIARSVNVRVGAGGALALAIAATMVGIELHHGGAREAYVPETSSTTTPAAAQPASHPSEGPVVPIWPQMQGESTFTGFISGVETRRGQPPQSYSIRATMTINIDGDAASGGWTTSSGAYGKLSAQASGPRKLKMHLTEVGPCRGSFNGGAALGPKGNVLRGFYAGHECGGSAMVRATFMMQRQKEARR